jgi:hypothetical protein
MVEAASHLNYCSYMFSDYCVQKEAAHQGLSVWDGDPVRGLDLIARRNERYGFLAENVSFENINVDEAFRRASMNLLSMQFIGFFDYLTHAAARLDHEFGLKVDLDIRRHETPRKPRLADLPSNVGAMLKRKTEADYEFFHEAERSPTAALPWPYRSWRKITRRVAA